MPKDNRQRLLQNISKEIHQLMCLRTLKPACERLRHLLDYQEELERERYLGRSSHYRSHDLTNDGPARFPISPLDYKELLRMSQTEFERLVRMYGSDPVFSSTGKKPQAPAKLQLATFIHRLASGNSVPSIKARFGITSEQMSHFEQTLTSGPL